MNADAPHPMSLGDPLETRLEFFPLVGKGRAKLFAKLDLHTVGDLLWHLPREVLDLTNVVSPAELKADEAGTVQGFLVDVDGRPTSRGSIVGGMLDCGTGFVRGVWFNQTWRWRVLAQAEEERRPVIFSGKPKWKQGGWEFAHPFLQILEPDDTAGDESGTGSDDRLPGGGLLLKYGLTEGVGMPLMRRVCRAAAEQFADAVPDPLPPAFRDANNLVPLPAAVRGLHAPRNVEQYEAGRRRVLFDDLFEFQLGLALRRRAWNRDARAPTVPVSAKVDARIRRLFPFRLTAGQEQAVADVRADIERPTAMHRLLQADVGAGKTVIAVYAMLAAVAAGYQAALMAPTELLAQQHVQTLEAVLKDSRVKRASLTGSLTAARRREVHDGLRDGEIDLVVGTQALIQDDVFFDRLGVVIIDEQHKFGVSQRAAFSRDGAAPHVLVMTATPIPRSLCLTQFGDLDVTAISDRPPGRQPVTTARVGNAVQRKKMWQFVREQMDRGRQLYVVAPRIDSANEAAGVEELRDTLRQTELTGRRVGLVHGRMDRQERADVMDEFRVGGLDVLISTTVIEVGVDVPNASLMVLTDATKFGLSQLHQLRGRIGRGAHRGYCFLMHEPAEPSTGQGSLVSTTEDAATRLAVMEQTEDGFEIAEKDFELRGAGDVLGSRQSGQTPLRVADLRRDGALLGEARKVAFDLVEAATVDAPEFAPLKRQVLDRFGELMDLPRSG